MCASRGRAEALCCEHVTQKFNCPARLKVVHKGSDNISEIWSAHEHHHDESRDNSSVFKERVVTKMRKLCARGSPPQDIRASLVDDLFDGDDKHEHVPSLRQVIYRR